MGFRPDPSVPVGSILPYGGATAPEGWLVCDGAAVSRTTYRGLWGVLGSAFGAGDGSTTFNLPDLRGRFPLGADGSHARGAAAGSLGHTHGGGTLKTGGDGASIAVQSGLGTTVARLDHTHDSGSTAWTGATGAASGEPAHQAVIFIIRAG